MNYEFTIEEYGRIYVSDSYLLDDDDTLLFFSARDEKGRLFLATASDENQFLFVRASLSTLAALVSKTIDMRSAFTSKVSTLWYVNITSDGKYISNQKTSLDNVPENDLPRKDVYLYSPLVSEEKSVILADSIENQRDRFRIRLKDKLDSSTIAVNVFVNIISTVNNLFKELANSLEGLAPLIQEVEPDHSMPFDLRLSPIKEGSVIIDFYSAHKPNPLFNESSFGRIIDKFIDIFDLTDCSVEHTYRSSA